jgi:hypothetical protein
MEPGFEGERIMSRLRAECIRSGSISLDFPLSLAEDNSSIAMALRQVTRLTCSTIEDHAVLRRSHTMRNTRIKKI